MAGEWIEGAGRREPVGTVGTKRRHLSSLDQVPFPGGGEEEGVCASGGTGRSPRTPFGARQE